MGYKLTKILKQNAVKNCLANSQKLPNTSTNVSQQGRIQGGGPGGQDPPLSGDT